MKAGQAVIAQFDPLSEPESVKKLAERKVAAFSLELMPRITRAQSMDVLSSQATVAGYKAVLVAAEVAPRMFPMFMTAAGTVRRGPRADGGRRRGRFAGDRHRQAPGRRSCTPTMCVAAVKEQIESLGGKFVEMELEAGEAEDKGGYAKDMGDETSANSVS